MDDTPAWMAHRACAGLPVAMFFPNADRGPLVDEPKKVCGRCDVRDDCLRHALEHHETFGIWGGMTADERSNSRRRSRRLALRTEQRTLACADCGLQCPTVADLIDHIAVDHVDRARKSNLGRHHSLVEVG